MKITECKEGSRVEPTVELSVAQAMRTPWEFQVSRSLVGWSISADGNVALLVSKADAMRVIERMEVAEAEKSKAARREQEEGV